MGNEERIQVNLCGQQFRISPPDGDADRLRRAAELVEGKIRAMQEAGVVASNRAALLVALEMTIDLLAVRDSPVALSEKDVSRAREQLDHVLGKIDEALSNPAH